MGGVWTNPSVWTPPEAWHSLALKILHLRVTEIGEWRAQKGVANHGASSDSLEIQVPSQQVIGDTAM